MSALSVREVLQVEEEAVRGPKMTMRCGHDQCRWTRQQRVGVLALVGAERPPPPLQVPPQVWFVGVEQDDGQASMAHHPVPQVEATCL